MEGATDECRVWKATDQQQLDTVAAMGDGGHVAGNVETVTGSEPQTADTDTAVQAQLSTTIEALQTLEEVLTGKDET
jgi:hypothetical protein